MENLLQKEKRDSQVARKSSAVLDVEKEPIATKAAVGYDFERMIQEAMEKAGDQPTDGQKPSVPASGQISSRKKVPVDPKKAALLDKRKKYDPRAALKNA
jgi:hypothetical protein